MENQNLFDVILRESNSNNIKDVSKEWDLVAQNETTKMCTCKKKHLVHLYEFKNNINEKVIHIKTID
jgi:hypothetical protein